MDAGTKGSLQTELRVRGAGYRRYCASASTFHSQFHRHWYRHILVAYSPEGILPRPFEIWGWGSLRVPRYALSIRDGTVDVVGNL